MVEDDWVFHAESKSWSRLEESTGQSLGAEGSGRTSGCVHRQSGLHPGGRERCISQFFSALGIRTSDARGATSRFRTTELVWRLPNLSGSQRESTMKLVQPLFTGVVLLGDGVQERLDCRCCARVMSPLFLLSPCSITSWCSYTVAMFETIAGYDSVGYLWFHVFASVHGVPIVVAGCGEYGPLNLALRASLGCVCRELTVRVIFVSPLSCCYRCAQLHAVRSWTIAPLPLVIQTRLLICFRGARISEQHHR